MPQSGIFRRSSMSNIKPLTQMKKFYAMKDAVVDALLEMKTRLNNSETCYTNIRPNKKGLIYFGVDNYLELHQMSFCMELEYKGVLLIFFYDPSENEDAVEYSFAFDWTDDEIESGTDEVFVDINIDEAELFQQSMVDDLQFLTVELHQSMIQYCLDVREALRIKLGHDESV